MTSDDPDLDTFERALLLELRSRAERNAEHAVPQPSAERRSGRSRGPVDRLRAGGWYTSAAAAAVAILVLALLIHVVRPEPAFAVTGRNGSKIMVKVARLEGADRLQQALRDRGVTSDITYLPPGKSCAANRYTDRRTPGLRLSVSADRFTVTIPPGAVGPGDTFVLSASVTALPNGVRASVEFGIATGPVAPCRIVNTS